MGVGLGFLTSIINQKKIHKANQPDAFPQFLSSQVTLVNKHTSPHSIQ